VETLGLAQALLTHIRLERKCVESQNTLAYYTVV
jgi:hypothetical protein